MKVLLVAALFFTGPAFAGRYDATWDPPARYAGEYTGQLVELRLHPSKIKATCAEFKIKARLGCATFLSRGKCLIITPDRNVGEVTPDAVRRHELGHCNGWPADHPAEVLLTGS